MRNNMIELATRAHTLDSREVAKMVGKKHAHLCRDIAGYTKALTESKIGFSDFFIEASYKDASGKSNKRYDITKQGCEMVANKLTGKKGILFTSEYVKRFNEMEQADAAAAARDSYMIEDPIARAQAWIRERQQYNDAITEVEKSKQLIGELKPKADYTDRILNSKSLVSITQIAKDYGMSGKAMNGKLHELGIIYKLGGQWLLYSRYQAKGYTHSETVDITHSDGRADVVMNTKWTQKGRLFLYQHLKKHGILPVIEQNQQPVLTIVG